MLASMSLEEPFQTRGGGGLGVNGRREVRTLPRRLFLKRKRGRREGVTCQQMQG